MVAGLTARQEKFVQELIKGKSQREAYKAAYNTKSTSASSIDSLASRLFKNVKVRSRFEELRGKAVKRTEEKAIITREEIIAEIASIAKDDMSNYLDFRTEKTVVAYDKETREPIIDYAPIAELKDSRTIDTKNIKEVSIGKDGQIKLKTYCRDAALYKLAELMGINKLAEQKQKLAEDKFEEEKNINGKKYW